MITGKNHVGFEFSAKGNKTYKTFNPLLNKENEATHVEASSEEIEEATKLAAEAFKTYKTVSGAKKAEFLNAIADEILALDDILCLLYTSPSPRD